jgi:hypothetical protein
MAPLGFVTIPAKRESLQDRGPSYGHFRNRSLMYWLVVCIIYYLSESPASGGTLAETLSHLIIGVVLPPRFV